MGACVSQPEHGEEFKSSQTIAGEQEVRHAGMHLDWSEGRQLCMLVIQHKPRPVPCS